MKIYFINNKKNVSYILFPTICIRKIYSNMICVKLWNYILEIEI